MTKVNLVGVAVALVAMSIALGARAEDQPKSVRIATVAYAHGNQRLYIGAAAVLEKQGWLENDLKQHGIKLEWIPVAPQSVGATINEAFANRSIDFAGYGDLPSIILNANGVETRLIVPGGRGNNVYLLVPAGSSAATLRDLKGKRIALHRGRPWEITFARLAASQGLQLSDFKIANLNPQAGAAALVAGNVDALVTLFDGYPLVDKGIARILWSTKTAGVDWKMRAELWAAKDFVQRYPAVVQIVANDYVRAAQWLSADGHFEEFSAILELAGQPQSVTRREYLDDSVSWKDRWSPLFDKAVNEHYRRGIAYSRETRLIREDVDVNRLLDPRFVSVALRDLHLVDFWVPHDTVSLAR